MRFVESMQIIAVSLTASKKKIIVGMYLDLYDSVLFPLSMKIDTAKLYILILTCLTFTLIQDQRDARKQKHLWQLSHQVLN